ncbi:MAG: hypothetical protein IPJ77_08180 [Planctomycetes bacterium]|nr:hypothetical protein [Planctomycetota bacterium]
MTPLAPPAPLGPLRRLGLVGAAWMLLVLATPGLVFATGSVVLATLALVPWALGARRPGPKAFWVEWLCAGVGLSAACFWTTKVLWITLLVVAIVPGLYMAFAGVVLRRMLARVPLGLAAAAAWTALETLRYVIEPPFGFGWLRLGHHASHVELLAGSARVWGVAGLSFVLAAVAGALAEAYLARSRGADAGGTATAGPGRASVVKALALPAALLALTVTLALATRAPATVPGPRVLLVQPAFEQQRKMRPPDARELLEESIGLTQKGLAAATANGGAPPDLVAWGEAMFPFSLADPELDAALAAGARTQPWAAFEIGPRELDFLRQCEEGGVRGALFGLDGGPRILPPETTFLTGSDYFAEQDGVIRRWNAVVAWDPKGTRVGWTSKAHLVPGGETMCGLERLAIVRELAHELAGYIPDLAARDEPNVLPCARPAERGGGVWRLGVSVCFDNAFEDPYTRPLRGPEGVDLHLVCSNEAWYEESFEYDQMLAFTRLAAIATGRSFVRATNAGVSSVFGPDGRELARLVVGGKDRMVRGTLVADVPIPADPTHRTPFVHLERFLLALWITLPILLTWLARRRPAA